MPPAGVLALPGRPSPVDQLRALRLRLCVLRALAAQELLHAPVLTGQCWMLMGPCHLQSALQFILGN